MKIALACCLMLLSCGDVGYAAMSSDAMMEVVQADVDEGAPDGKASRPVPVPWQKQSKPQRGGCRWAHEPSLRVWLLRYRFEKNKDQQLNGCIRSLAVVGEAPLTTSLHDACLWGDIKTFDVLVADKSLVNALDASGATPLHYVVGCPWLVKPAENAAEEAKAKYAEQCAIRCKMMRALLRAGASLTACDLCGDTPMDYAQDGKHDALVSCLERLIAVSVLLNVNKGDFLYEM
jgi:hypothetical protein